LIPLAPALCFPRPATLRPWQVFSQVRLALPYTHLPKGVTMVSFFSRLLPYQRFPFFFCLAISRLQSRPGCDLDGLIRRRKLNHLNSFLSPLCTPPFHPLLNVIGVVCVLLGRRPPNWRTLLRLHVFRARYLFPYL